MSTDGSKLDRSLVPAPGYAFGHWKNVAILVWVGQADGERARAATDFADELMEQYDKFSIVHVADGNTGLPTPEGREAFVKAARNGHDRAACVGLLLPHTGVVTTMLLTFVRSIRTLVRGNLHVIAEPDVKALVRAFAPAHTERTGVAISMSELAAVIEETRALAAVPGSRTPTSA